MFARFVRRARLRPRLLAAGSVVAVLALCGVASAAVLGVPLGNGQAEKNPFAHRQVGEVVDGKLLVADDQWIAPPSDTKRVEFSDQDALGGTISPDGQNFATASGGGGTGAGLRIVDLKNGEILQNVPSVNSTGTGGIIYFGRWRLALGLGAAGRAAVRSRPGRDRHQSGSSRADPADAAPLRAARSRPGWRSPPTARSSTSRSTATTRSA